MPTETTTNNVQDILKLSSASILEYLQRAVPILRNNLESLRSSNPEDGAPVLIQSIEGLQLVNEFLHSASEATVIDDADLSSSYAIIASKIQKDMHLIIDAMENKDMPLLADVMEFELIDSLDQLQQLLAKSHGNHL
jgi:hypothetical protein